MLSIFDSLIALTAGETAALVLLALFGFLMSMENRFAWITLTLGQVRQSYACNISLFAINSVIVSFLSASLLMGLSQHSDNPGLLDFIPYRSLQGLIAFIGMDFLLYGIHWLCHRWERLWVCHRVHHCDPYLNITTAFRIHIAELCFITVLKAGYVILMGIDQQIVLILEAVFSGFIMFHHTNIRFPGEYWLSHFIITPSLHRSHHSVKRHEHDSNYGAVLTLWDRLFGTLLMATPERIGIAAPSPQTALGLVYFGFANTHLKPLLNKPPTIPDNVNDMIAEAAYYKAEKRAFYPGHELNDWLEAKQEILRRYGNKSLPV